MFEQDLDPAMFETEVADGLVEVPVVLSAIQLDRLTSLVEFTGIDFNDLVRRAVEMLLEKSQTDAADWKSARGALDDLWQEDPDISTDPLDPDAPKS